MRVLLTLLLTFFFTLSFSQDTGFPKKPIVYVFPVVGEINDEMDEYFTACIKDASKKKADVIIISMDSYGGYVSSCDEIRTTILRSPTPIWTLVDNKAISAGAMITVSTEKIFMTEDALMGASTVVVDRQPLYDKFQSLARARMRGSAYLNCRDPKIAENMVGYYDTLSSQERVLSLTPGEAIKVGYCNGIYPDVMSLVQTEVPGAVIEKPSKELIKLAMVSQVDVELEGKKTGFQFSWQAIIDHFLKHAWLFAVLYALIIVTKKETENKVLRESLGKILELIKTKK